MTAMQTSSEPSVEKPQLEAGTYTGAASTSEFGITDIRSDREQAQLSIDIFAGLRPQDGRGKSLPTLLLYDETGLKLFEDITYLEEYYLTEAEIEVLHKYADAIAKCLKPGSIILELGSGNLRKINILLNAIERAGVSVSYYALDLSLPELVRTISAIDQSSFQHVKIAGLHGTYDDGLAWLQTPAVAAKPKAILSMGSSIGNFTRSEAAGFLLQYTQLLRPDDLILIGLDGCKDPERVYHAYNDREGVTYDFILNGLRNANSILKKEVFKLDQWRVVGEYHVQDGKHHAFVSPVVDLKIDGIPIQAHERIHIEHSYKYSHYDAAMLWSRSGLEQEHRWTNERGDYSLYALSKAMDPLLLQPSVYAANPAPSWTDWRQLWQLWDTVTRAMIPDQELTSQPIKLRNACIFYLGHIPTFLDLKLSDTLNEKRTDPEYFAQIFERGVDPDVDNPAHVHKHSEIPESWPALEEILVYQDSVRQRVKGLYETGSSADLEVARCLWLGYEHEYMHLETLLYMLLQCDKTLPPPTKRPDFTALAHEADEKAIPNEWFSIPASDITIGLDDPEDDASTQRHFGWDIEKPPRTIHVKAFSAQARPITNGDYARYLEAKRISQIPASWGTTTTKSTNELSNGNSYTASSGHMNGHTNGYTNGLTNGHGTTNTWEAAHPRPSPTFISNKTVKTVYGAIPLALALHWPVAASYDELKGCAAWLGGRIPTLEEARAIYNYVDLRSRKGTQKTHNQTTPGVNGHLVNDGVEETPPSRGFVNNGANGAVTKTALDPYETFADLSGCNVGFQQWHPMPVTQNGNRLSGLSDMGGVWEWTSTPLAQHEGFKPMKLYPVYSADFFDTKHNVILGGSWATAPRIAGRKTFVNWYQRNYPYMWAGARLVKDI